MNEFYDALVETSSLKEFLSCGNTHIQEDEYIELRNRCITEAFGVYKPTSMSDAYRYWTPRQDAFKNILIGSNITIHWNSEFEDRLRDYIKEQGPNPGIGPIGKTEWYSQKRKELEDIMTREDNDVGC